MSYNILKLKHLFAFVCLIILIFLFAGCVSIKGRDSGIQPIPLEAGKIVVLGFRPAIALGGKPDVIRSPISGTVLMAEPVPTDVADKMTALLFDQLLEYKRYELIGPGRARGVFSSLVSEDQGISDISIFKKIGQAFSADAVMTGQIYRWQEREGKDYSVNRPASVAFDLYLIKPENGAILWKGKFDKTQLSLSENLFDLRTFIKGKGKWMTVEGLAELGLDELLQKSLPVQKEKGD
jgi:hypothetical protein